MDDSFIISELHSLKHDYGEDFSVNLPQIESGNTIKVGLNLKSLTENEAAKESVLWIELKEEPNIEFKPHFAGSNEIIEKLRKVCGVQGLKGGILRKVINKMNYILSDTGTEPILMKSLSHLNQNEDFTIVKKIGSGSFGNVFLCKSSLDGNFYAIKEVVFYKIDYKRKMREIEAISKMDHPNVVRYYQCWVDETGKYITVPDKYAVRGDSALYIVMAYYTKTLKDTIKEKEEGLTHQEIRKYLKEIAKGLNEIHSKNIIHGDLNPSNIFIDDTGSARIGDFGVARVLEQGMEDYRPSQNEGTFIYRAPEIQGLKSQFTKHIDSYALGLILLELAHPMSFTEKITVFKEAREDHVIPPLGDEFLENLANGLLSHNIKDRTTPKNIVDMLEALE